MNKILTVLTTLFILNTASAFADWYIDPVNGSSGNAGTSWAAPKKYINDITTGNITTNPNIRMAKSPDPTSLGITGAFTYGSNLITLSSALTSTIDATDTSWTASTNVTASQDSTNYKVGTGSPKLVIASGFTTGKIAYRTLPSTKDLSSYQQVSFWIYTSAAIASKGLTLNLCSDSTGDVVVNSFALQDLAIGWTQITMNYGSALGSTINSLSLSVTVDPVTPTINISNVIACKAPSSTTLTLNTLIGTVSNGRDDGPWYHIRSIDGTALYIEPSYSLSTSVDAAIGGVLVATNSYNLYARECINIASWTAAQTTLQGTGAKLYGGYNTSNDTQDGYTFFDNRNSKTYLVICGTTSQIDGVGGTNSPYGFSMSANGVINSPSLLGCHYGFKEVNKYPWSATIGYVYGLYVGDSLSFYNTYGCSYTGKWLNRISIYGLRYGIIDVDNLTNFSTNNSFLIVSAIPTSATGAGCANVKFYIDNLLEPNATASTTGLLHLDSFVGELYANTIECGGAYLFTPTGNVLLKVYGPTINGTSSLMSSGANYPCYVNISMFNTTVNNPTYTSLASLTLAAEMSISSTSTDGNVVVEKYGRTAKTQTAVRHTASGFAWQYSLTGGVSGSDFYEDMNRYKIATISCVANKQVTYTVWARRTNTGLTGGIVVPAYQLSGMTAEVSDYITADADTWEQLSIQFTPTSTGSVDVYAESYGGDTYSMFLDDATIAIQDTTVQLKTMDYVANGGPNVTNYVDPSTGGGSYTWIQ